MSLDYPSTLPNPTKSAHSPRNRVSSTDVPGPAAYAGRERDYSGTIAVEFFLTAEQAAIFYLWWRDDLLYGGRWFNCNWPALRAGAMVVQFLQEPTFGHVYNGAHRISAVVQVRGATQVVDGYTDPLYDSTILVFNMKDTLGTAPPTDSSKYQKVYGVYGTLPLYAVDAADGPFGGCRSADLRYNLPVNPPKCAATDTAWDFDPSVGQTLTIEGWVKVMAVNGNGLVATVRPIASAGSGNWVWPWFFFIGGIVRAGFNIVGSTPLDLAAGISPNVWAHYVLQYTGTTVYLGVAGTRIGLAGVGINTFSNLMLQFGNSSIGTVVGSGALLGPHRVTIANRYSLHTNTTYVPPTSAFPVRA